MNWCLKRLNFLFAPLLSSGPLQRANTHSHTHSNPMAAQMVCHPVSIHVVTPVAAHKPLVLHVQTVPTAYSHIAPQLNHKLFTWQQCSDQCKHERGATDACSHVETNTATAMSARGWLHYYLQAFHLLCAGGRHHSTPKCNIHPQQSSPGPTATGTFHMSQSFYMSRVSMLVALCVLQHI